MNVSRKVLVTGATGFVGRALVRRLSASPDYGVVAATRRGSELPEGVASFRIDDVGSDTDWSAPLAGCDVVVHLAARVHQTAESADSALDLYREVNTYGTVTLARQAADLGVRRFVFVSTIKVNGEETVPDRPFTADDPPAPLDPYGRSKAEAEAALLELAATSGMDVVIVRPPLVYGPGARANFLALTQWLARGVPLPLGAVRDNRRTLLALDNLIDLIERCIDHSAAANQIFLAGDGEDLSTAELLRRTAEAMQVRARLVNVPVSVLRAGGTILGRSAMVQRLCGSLQADISKTRRALDWQPPVGVDEGLRRAVGRRPHG